MKRERSPGTSPPRVHVVGPPLPLSERFIDYPYLTVLAFYQAAAALRCTGADVPVTDGLSRPAAGLAARRGGLWLGEPGDAFLERVRRLDGQAVVVVGSPFLTTGPGRAWLTELVAAIREGHSGVVVLADAVVGGMHYLEHDAEALLAATPGLDLVLRYEAEPLLERLVGALRGGRRPRGVWATTAAFPLDDLPGPAWDLLDHEAFFAFLGRTLASPLRQGPFPPEPSETLPLVTARGCPYGCVFCTTNPGLDGDRRQRRVVPLDRVAAWVERWVRETGVRRVVLLDDVANLPPQRFDGILDLLEAHDLRVELPNGLRADLVTEDHVRRLAKRTSGLKVSLESASRRVQDEVLGKRLNPASVEQVAAWCHERRLPLAVHCLVGTPGERREEVLATLREAARLERTYGVTPLVQYATPLPGSRLERECRAAGLLPDLPDDPATLLQERSVLTTPELDPSFLHDAVEAFGKLREGHTDRKVIVNLTYRCNNHCVFCAVGDREARDAALPAVVAALRRYRAEGYELLDVDGGEPTLHPGLPELVEEAGRLGFRRVCLITNGRAFAYPGVARRLVAAGLDEVLVSLHAADAAQAARITGVPESFGQTTKGLATLLGMLGPERVGVNTTVTAVNVATLPALGALLARLGVRRWAVQLVTPFGRATADQVPDEAALRTALTALLDDPPGGLAIQVVNCPPCLLPGHEHAAATDFAKAGRDMVFVGAEGENLQAFLAGRRDHGTHCGRCAWSLLCPGLYAFAAPV